MEEILTIDKHSIRVTNLQKIFYPSSGFTKGDLIAYYMRVAPVLIPHLKERPLSLKRYPDGINGISFYEKQCPSHRPDWMNVAPIWSKTRNANIQYCLVNNVASLVWAANIAVLELHTSLSKARKMHCPTSLVFDLDPGEGVGMRECCQLGMRVRQHMERDGLQSFAKTSGSKGLQIYVPLNGQETYEDTKPYARRLAQILELETPDKVVSKMSKTLRRKRIFVDWSQNDEHKTTVCVYSLRAKDEPSVSTPLTWDEVERASRSQSKSIHPFAPDAVLKRIEKHGDLFAPVLKLKQRLPRVPVSTDSSQ